ncbi:nucleotidyl transferase AbiEii/AbiGii toxin family protein [Mycoplasma sp. CSL7503-lung]|uniref:nucleotidyl transferase AbiEii/AbiGii toxin family protein n=1 Tax=Mycoplasma sp. CSL7503-lung TaxID=536372 RepID=UPI0021D2FEA6|nr:nucleotidyl transferase AbiEii/AbiGii toxin family protein [Mycoplasma sp. CSL7503-lung]MCU4706813.1 nucleotidyl transferase AbiEii/AbiGii toxin family protein [Mycoplasma sp. CSL7503-lung]
MKYKKIEKIQLEKIIKNTSQRKGINESIIEKDYWVCFVLNYLFNEFNWKHYFTFKGGTSLSKCFNLIERFSEYIDLVLDSKFLGWDFSDLLTTRSRTQQEKINKNINKKTAEFLKNEMIPIMFNDFQKILNEEFDIRIADNDAQTILFEYPKSFTSKYLTQSIRIEVGVLSTSEPSKK